MAQRLIIRPSKCADCFDAFRPSTSTRGTIKIADVAPRYRKMVEANGRAVAIVPNKAMQMEAK